MGDMLEFSTSPKPHNVFYKVTGSATTFAIRAHANAVIGLSVAPGNNECKAWVIVAYNGRCWIKTCGGDIARSVMNNSFLCPNEYRKFWLTWYNGTLCLGEEGFNHPIVSCSERTYDFKYITFTVLAQMNHGNVQWQINMPPALESKKPKAEIKGLPHWTLLREGQEFPDDALIAGYENEVLYIARAPHMGSLTPGKYVPSAGKAYISWDGRANEKTDEIEILCGFNLLWVHTERHKIPVGAFAVGYSEIGSEQLYVGRALQDGHLIPGKFHSPYLSLLYSYKGRECSANNFEILVLPGKNDTVEHDTFCFDSQMYVHPEELDATVIDNDID